MVLTLVLFHSVTFKLVKGELKSELLSNCQSYAVIVPPNVGAFHENVGEENDNPVGAPGADKSVCELPPLLCVINPFTKYVSCSSTSIDTISTSLCSISIDVIKIYQRPTFL